MRSIKARLDRLEADARPKSNAFTFISYEAPQTGEQAIADWEAENGPISGIPIVTNFRRTLDMD
jgi:hypothetical protein